MYVHHLSTLYPQRSENVWETTGNGIMNGYKNYIVARNQTQSSVRATIILNHWANFLTSLFLTFKMEINISYTQKGC